MTLLNLVRKDKNARKIFGKRELKIIEKQLLGVNLTQSEKNRLSRDIRKKLEFISKISGFKEEFDLKKGAEIKKMINEAKKVILNDKLAKKIKEIWLFGSAAENKMTLRSDIDIAVLFNKINVKDVTKFRIRVSGRVPDKIDIQVFNVLPKKLKQSILKNYKVLYKNEQAKR